MIGNPALSSQDSTSGVDFVSNFVPAAIGLSLLIGVVFFFAVLVAGAIQWIGSGGDKQSLEGARSRVTNAIIGIIVLFSVYAILSLIETFFDITILTLDLAPLVIQ